MNPPLELKDKADTNISFYICIRISLTEVDFHQ